MDGTQGPLTFKPAGDLDIRGLTADSRLVKPGFLFAALPHWRPLATLSTGEKLAAFSDRAVRRDLADDLERDSSMGLLTARLRTMWDILRVTEVHSTGNAAHLGRLVGDIEHQWRSGRVIQKDKPAPFVGEPH